MNIAFIPIDNRPVCYTLVEQICAINENINLFLPSREYLGGLKKIADIESIFNWFENLEKIDVVIVSLDTIAYGGLIPSRRSNDSFEVIKDRIERLKKLLQNKKVFAFSSIMRISNNNINEEEKIYWDKWGKKIFNYSFCMDKFGTVCKKEVPDEILDDYLATRKRNFEINKIYLDWQKEGFFDTLVFSKDDCAEYGFNVQEARELEKLGGFVKTGADEIPLSLLSRSISFSEKQKSGDQEVRLLTGKNFSSCQPFIQPHKIKVAPIFLEPEYKHLISNYEDISIENSVKSQLELAGCEVCEEKDADILLYVNNFEDHQGEIVMRVPTKPFSAEWKRPEKPYIVADVRYANGADNEFVKKLFDEGLGDNFCGYSAWNTSANTLGSLICAAKMYLKAKPVAIKDSSLFTLNSSPFIKYQIIRFLDDWAYQANVRQQLKSPNEKELKEKMKPYEDVIFDLLGVKYDISYKFPWNRLFEVEICI